MKETQLLKTKCKKQILKLKKLLLYKESKLISLINLTLLVTMCFIGCETAISHQNNLTSLVASSIPPFPHPSALVADELEKVCPNNKCKALFEWIGKLKVLQEQLKLYEKEYE